MTELDGSYIYLATRGLDEPELKRLTGIADAPVRLVHSGDLSAVVSTVDLSEFGEEALRENLEDLDWLQQIAAAHDHVIGSVSELVTVAPLRLATIVYDDARAVTLLTEWADELNSALDRVQDRWEWSVKIVTDPDRSTDTPETTDRPASGAAYLQRRKAQMTRSTESAEASAAMAERTHQNLSAHTAASRLLPPQDRKLTGHRGEMTLNGAYLVERGNGDEFARYVEQLAQEHPDVTVELNGPWPPYSFATLEASGQT